MANVLQLDRVKKLNEIGIALSLQRNLPLLLETILSSAQLLTDADGGSIYSVTPEKTLHFDILRNDSLHLHKKRNELFFPDIPLFFADGTMNEKTVVSYAVNHRTLLNIKDAYQEEGFDFLGTRIFDERNGYRTKAVLVVPITNHEGDVVAVLQLINPKEKLLFSEDDVEIVSSLASQAGVALSNQQLITNLRKLFESFVRVLVKIIDEKSPSTGHHGKRVPILADLFARASGQFTEAELYELQVAALLHDCGKIVTPMHVIEKSKKLETIFDRMALIVARYELLKVRFPEKRTQYEEEILLLKRLNDNKERVTEEIIAQVKEIAQREWRQGETLLSQDEVENLLIEKGNLTAAERQIIENHVVMTARMLEELIYPKELARVAEIAASHHERVDGKGYPRQLKGSELSTQAKILAISDVFEALSAPDRPYKKALPLSIVLQIMQDMVDEGHFDRELFLLFREKKVYLTYAKDFLALDQIDIG